MKIMLLVYLVSFGLLFVGCDMFLDDGESINILMPEEYESSTIEGYVSLYYPRIELGNINVDLDYKSGSYYSNIATCETSSNGYFMFSFVKETTGYGSYINPDCFRLDVYNPYGPEKIIDLEFQDQFNYGPALIYLSSDDYSPTILNIEENQLFGDYDVVNLQWLDVAVGGYDIRIEEDDSNSNVNISTNSYYDIFGDNYDITMPSCYVSGSGSIGYAKITVTSNETENYHSVGIRIQE